MSEELKLDRYEVTEGGGTFKCPGGEMVYYSDVKSFIADNNAALHAELAALKAGQGEAVAVMRFQLKHPFSGESRIVEVNRADVVEGMEDALFEKLGDLICQCESVGETNVVDCNCDDYIYDFDLVPDVVTAPPSSADAVSVPREFPAADDHEKAIGWEYSYEFISQVERLVASRTEFTTSMEAVQETLKAACELRALLAQSESKVKP